MYDLIEQYLQFQETDNYKYRLLQWFCGDFQVNAYVEGRTAVEIENNWWHNNCWFHVYSSYLRTKFLKLTVLYEYKL